MRTQVLVAASMVSVSILIFSFLPSAAQSGSLASGPPAAAAKAVSMCTASQLSLGTDSENGNFDGMSHSGTLVVLRNLSDTACKVDAVPQIGFTDGTKDLGIKGTPTGAGFMPPHSGHGPVLLPVIVAPGAEVTSTLRWVSGEVYDDSVCIVPKMIVVTIGRQTQQTDFDERLCGDRVAGVQFEMSKWRVDPVWTGK